MSGITGIFRRDGLDVNPADIKKMNDKISYRGHDGSRIWCDGQVAFGHQMLHTTSESLHEILPFEDIESGLVITADARIDNRKDLAPKLGIADNENLSDSYFILKSYEKWGEKCTEELLGDFAFAIWNKNNETIYCARDHMGVKPFYYYLSSDIFVFSTEFKALFSNSNVPSKLNEERVALYLLNIRNKKSTFFESVYSLVAANFLIVDEKHSKISNYWEINPNSSIRMDSDEHYIQAFKEIFKEAVKCRLRSAFPIGFELSGGVDSSSIVCMANKIFTETNSMQRLNTFSYVFNDFPEVDERYYINKVADNVEIKKHYFSGDKVNPLKHISSILDYQGQPFFTPNMAIIWNLYEKMKSKEIRVLLGGNGGDEIISHGANYLPELAVTLRWKKLINEMYSISKHSSKNFLNLFFKYFMVPLVPNTVKKIIRPYYDSNIFILNKEFAEKLGGEDYLNQIKWQFIQHADTAKKHHYVLINLHHYVLEMLDRVSSAFFIEPRYPYYDKRLVEFCYGIPNEIKFRFGWDRYIQRIAMDGILPPEIQWRYQKTNFNPVYEKNLLLESKLLEEMIYTDNKSIKDYVDVDILDDIYKKYVNGKADNNLISLWLSLILFLWLREINK